MVGSLLFGRFALATNMIRKELSRSTYCVAAWHATVEAVVIFRRCTRAHAASHGERATRASARQTVCQRGTISEPRWVGQSLRESSFSSNLQGLHRLCYWPTCTTKVAFRFCWPWPQQVLTALWTPWRGLSRRVSNSFSVSLLRCRRTPLFFRLFLAITLDSLVFYVGLVLITRQLLALSFLVVSRHGLFYTPTASWFWLST